MKNFFLIFTLLMCGCAHRVWYQEGKSYQDMVKDLGACKYKSMTDAKHKDEETALKDSCMEAKGYIYTSKENVPPDYK